MQTPLLSIKTRCFSSILFIIMVLKFHTHSNTNMINILKYKISIFVPRVRVQFKTTKKENVSRRINTSFYFLNGIGTLFLSDSEKNSELSQGFPGPLHGQFFSLEDYKTRYPLESEAIYSKPVLGNSSVLLYADMKPVQLIPSLLFLHT